ncbi:MAG TPA: hypothetical protein VNN80_34200 [Polyangiaceae bacterium]|nr:hypothetical protein [Polyangiaceae bacterium]
MTERRSLQIVMEGLGAEAAARDFFSKGWFEAEWERREVPGTVPVVSAKVLAIAAGSVTVADKMILWWQGWCRSGDGAAGLAVVVQAPGGTRVPLDATSRDSLVDLLRALHAPPR